MNSPGTAKVRGLTRLVQRGPHRGLLGLGAQQAHYLVQLHGDVARALRHRVGRPQRAMPVSHLLLGLMRQRRVDQV
jgi:hypothetical protein